MTPVEQTVIGNAGNCFEACIASIFECGIAEVPDLNAHLDDGKWLDVLQEWLAPKDLCYMEMAVKLEEYEDFFTNKNFWHTIIIPSERIKDGYHAVVGFGGKVVFDPYPDSFDRNGEKLDQDGYIHCGIFVRAFKGFEVFV